MFNPINSPFFHNVDNKYAYLAHDDGWFCRLYCKNMNDFKEILSNKVIKMVSTSKRREIYPMSDDVKEQLFNLCSDGLLIDFSYIYKDERQIQIRIFTIGEFLNMDEMYNGLERHKYNSKYSAWLIHKNKKWRIEN